MNKNVIVEVDAPPRPASVPDGGDFMAATQWDQPLRMEDTTLECEILSDCEIGEFEAIPDDWV